MAKGKRNDKRPQEGYQPEGPPLDPNDPPGSGFIHIKEGAFDIDPRINPEAWDEKCWEASMIIASGLGEGIDRKWKDFSTWLHTEAADLTRLHYGERPMDND